MFKGIFVVTLVICVCCVAAGFGGKGFPKPQSPHIGPPDVGPIFDQIGEHLADYIDACKAADKKKYEDIQYIGKLIVGKLKDILPDVAFNPDFIRGNAEYLYNSIPEDKAADTADGRTARMLELYDVVTPAFIDEIKNLFIYGSREKPTVLGQ